MKHGGRLEVPYVEHEGCVVVRPAGTLDSLTYRDLRDQLVKHALELPRAVVADLSDLRVPAETALTAFSAASSRVSDWPGVPILLVVSDPGRYAELSRTALTRFVPLFRSVRDALASLPGRPPRRVARTEYPPQPVSSALARKFVKRTCEEWCLGHHGADAVQVAVELVENALQHAATPFALRLELRAQLLTVAVRDGSPRVAVLRQDASGLPAGHGLHIVADLARIWGCAPDLRGGKVVWAVLLIGAERFRGLPPWPVP